MLKVKFNSLQEFMDTKGWTEARTADHFNCSVSTISMVANKKRRPGGELAMRMAAAGINVNFHFEVPNVAS
jgi:transcriptional regulator with XRE-family HTH domain